MFFGDLFHSSVSMAQWIAKVVNLSCLNNRLLNKRHQFALQRSMVAGSTLPQGFSPCVRNIFDGEDFHTD